MKGGRGVPSLAKNQLRMRDRFKQGVASGGSSDQPPRSSVADRLAHFEERQRHLWRLTYFLLGLLTLAYVVVSWQTIQAFAGRYEFLLPILVLAIAAFIAYAWKLNKEIAELRGLVRGIEQGVGTAPGDLQLDKLFSVIERSQQGYR